MNIIRKIIGRILQFLFPSYSYCGRCGWTWNIVEGHSTPYSPTSGMFPLCNHCWSVLTPKERLLYYHQLWNKWRQDAIKHKMYRKQGIENYKWVNWFVIRKAVLQGL